MVSCPDTFFRANLSNKRFLKYKVQISKIMQLDFQTLDFK